MDSCGELPPDLKADEHFELVPLELIIEDYRTWDDKNFDQVDFLSRVARSDSCAKSACPSPERYLRAMDTPDDTDLFVVTLSGALSGSYNSAKLAADMFLEEHPGRNIHVFDSCSASCGETQISLFAQKLCEEGLSFDEIVQKTSAFRDDMTTYFVLDDLNPLKKKRKTDRT